MAIVVDGSSTGNNQTWVSSVSYAHTHSPSDSDTDVVIGIIKVRDAAYPTAVTYGGTNMTYLGGAADSTPQGNGLWVYGLDTPATGSNTYAATVSAGTYQMSTGMISISGCSIDITTSEFEYYNNNDQWLNQTFAGLVGDELIVWCISDTHDTNQNLNPNTGGLTTRVDGAYSNYLWAGTYQASGASHGLQVSDHKTGHSAGAFGGGVSLKPFSDVSFLKRSQFFFSLAGLAIPAATLAGLYKAGAVEL